MYKKSIASFMCVLIITLPIYAAFVFGELERIRVHGDDGVEGYTRGNNDNFIIEALAKLDDDEEISKEQVKFKRKSKYIEFKECRAVSEDDMQYFDYFNCSYTNSVSFFEKLQNIIVYLYNDSEELKEQASKVTVKNDDAAPLIEVIGQPEFNKDDKTYLVSVKVTDKDNDGKGCSGIDKVEFYFKNNLLETKNVSEIGVCVEEFSAELLIEDTGDSEITIKAYDKLGNEDSINTNTFYIDNEKPSIASSFKITYKDSDREREYFSMGTEFDGNVVIEIAERNLSYVKADLSSLNINPAFTQSYKSLVWNKGSVVGPVRCVEAATNLWECRFLIRFRLDSENKEISVTAIDEAGNENTETSSIIIKKDDSPPDILDIITENCNIDRTECYVKKGNNKIILEINEKGAGFVNDYQFGSVVGKKLFLNLESLNDAYKGKCMVIQDCESFGERWVCSIIAEVEDKTQGSKLSVNVRKDCGGYHSEDDAGNEVVGVLKKEFVYDTVGPVVKNITIMAEGGRTDYFKYRDILTITAFVSDDISAVEKAYANLSILLGSGYDNIETPCGISGSDYSCVWEADDISAPHKDETLSFLFFDFAGNNASGFKNITVLEPAPENRSYWKIGEVEGPMPPYVNKKTSSLTNHRVYFKVKLVMDGSWTDLEPLVTKIEECTPADSVAYFQDYKIMNSVKGETELMLKFTLVKEEIIPDEIPFICTLSIISRHGTQISDPEYENVSMTIQLEPLLEIGERINDEIKDVRDSWLVSGGLMKTLKKAIKILEAPCLVLNTVTAIVGVFQSIELLFETLDWTPWKGIAIIVGITDEAGGSAFKEVYQFFKKYCEFFSCRYGNLWGKLSERIDNWASETVGKSALLRPTQASIEETLDPKNSLILSMITLCIPGIVYNLEKARQVQCRYIQCLENDVTYHGQIVSACVNERSFLFCKLVYGELFNLIPFAVLIDEIGNMFVEMLTDPLGIIGMGMALVCMILNAAGRTPHVMCQVLDLASAVGDVFSSIASYKDYGNPPGDVCRRIGVDD